MKFNYVPTVCPFCGTGCSFNLAVKEGKVAGTAPFQRSPVCDGKTCQKGHFAYELVNSEARITKPLVKKDGKLVEASWEEALTAAAKIASFGADTCVYAPSNTTNEDIIAAVKFGKEVLKTSRITSAAAVGVDARADAVLADIAKADCILIFGNLVESHPLAARRAAKAKDNGAKVVVADYYRSPTAKLASQFVKAEPGKESEALQTAAEAVSGKNVFVLYGVGVTCGEAAIAKKLQNIADAKKAKFIALPAQSNGRGAITLGAGNCCCASSEGAKAFYVIGEDIGPLDAEFVVVQDSFLTSTAQSADVVLPSAVFAETDGTAVNAEGRVQLIRKAQEPAGESKANWQITAELAAKCGADFGYKSAEEVFKTAFADLSYEGIKKDGAVLPASAPVIADVQVKPVETSAEFPFKLVTAASVWHGFGGSGTLSQNCRSLVREVPSIFVKISAADAKELGIIAKDEVKVTTAAGSVSMPVMIVKDMEKGVIFVPTMSIAGKCIFMLTGGEKCVTAKIEKMEA